MALQQIDFIRHFLTFDTPNDYLINLENNLQVHW